MTLNTHKQHDGSGDSPSGESPGLSSNLLELVDGVAGFFADYDPASDDGAKTFGPEILEFLLGLKDRIGADGEQSYMTRRVALFFIDLMSLRLRRGRSQDEVPHEHAAVLDAASQKVQGTRSGVTGDPDVDRLAKLEDKRKEWMSMVAQEAGLRIKVPKDPDTKLIVS